MDHQDQVNHEGIRIRGDRPTERAAVIGLNTDGGPLADRAPVDRNDDRTAPQATRLRRSEGHLRIAEAIGRAAGMIRLIEPLRRAAALPASRAARIGVDRALAAAPGRPVPWRPGIRVLARVPVTRPRLDGFSPHRHESPERAHRTGGVP
jgi:hypothetical protein